MVQFQKNSLRSIFWDILSLTHENAADLHSACRVPEHSQRMSAQNTHCQQHESLSLHDLPSTGRRLLEASFLTSLKSNLWTALTTRNTTKIILLYKYLTHTHTHTHGRTRTHTQNTTALQPNVLLNVIYQLLVTSKGRSTFPASNNVKVNRKLLGQCLYV